jgi:uncharacterized membrane protein YkvA (DUF1232 family)
MASFREGLWRVRSRAGRLAREVQVYRLALADPRTPPLARVLLALAIGYALSPIDLIPDFLPLIGHLDDALLVPLLLAAAVALIPVDVLDSCRRRAGGAGA